MNNPHFFCENCGVKVPLRAKQCPRCGRLFQSVRCPSCGFTGEEALFTRGCPVCGYTVSGESGWSAKGGGRQNKGKWAAAGTLPLWIYLLAVLFFIGVCTVLFTILKN
jgi:ssDNA-binding Zn-finger/Zn-ribbon topoisomerase 1